MNHNPVELEWKSNGCYGRTAAWPELKGNSMETGNPVRMNDEEFRLYTDSQWELIPCQGPNPTLWMSSGADESAIAPVLLRCGCGDRFRCGLINAKFGFVLFFSFDFAAVNLYPGGWCLKHRSMEAGSIDGWIHRWMDSSAGFHPFFILLFFVLSSDRIGSIWSIVLLTSFFPYPSRFMDC